MPKISGVNHLKATRALEKAGLGVAAGKAYCNANGERNVTIPRHNPVNALTMGGIVRDAGLTPDEFNRLIKTVKNKNNLNPTIAFGILLVVGCACPPPNENSGTSGTQSNQSLTNATNAVGNAANALANGANKTSANTPRPFKYQKDGLQLVSSKRKTGGFGVIAIMTDL